MSIRSSNRKTRGTLFMNLTQRLACLSGEPRKSYRLTRSTQRRISDYTYGHALKIRYLATRLGDDILVIDR